MSVVSRLGFNNGIIVTLPHLHLYKSEYSIHQWLSTNGLIISPVNIKFNIIDGTKTNKEVS